MAQVRTARDITVFGHRGARGIYPENTMAGFRYLRDIGVDAVEIDVQNAKGRVPVVAHDPYISQALARDQTGNWITGVPQPILDTPITELARLPDWMWVLCDPAPNMPRDSQIRPG